jgi:hypothetical protein
VKKVDKLSIRRPAVSTVPHVILEFYKLRFGDLPAGRERAKLSEVFGMRNIRI